MSSLELFINKSRKDAISDQSLDKVLSQSLVHFNLLPFQSSRNWGNPVNTEIYKIIHSRLTLPIISLILQLIPVWGWTFFLRPGAHFLLYHYSFTGCHRAHNWLPEMSQKHIALFHYTIHNGLPQLSAWEATPSPLTQPYALGQDHQLGCTEQFGMQPLTYYSLRALDLYPVGLMTIFSSASKGSFFPNTTNREKYGIQISCQEVSTGMVEESGLEVEHSKMEHLRSGMKIAFFLAETFPTFQLDLQKMRYTPTISTTSTPYLKNLASPGRLQKTSLSLVL